MIKIAPEPGEHDLDLMDRAYRVAAEGGHKIVIVEGKGQADPEPVRDFGAALTKARELEAHAESRASLAAKERKDAEKWRKEGKTTAADKADIRATNYEEESEDAAMEALILRRTLKIA